MQKKKENQKGFAAFYVTVLILAVVFAIAASISMLTHSQQKISQNIIKSSQAYYIAEAGIEDSLYRIIKNKKYEATNDLDVGDGIATISIASQAGKKIIKSNGEISQRTRILEAVLSTETSTVAFYYGAQIGKGGLWLGSNASVQGNVYSNGNIIGQGKGSGSKITGDGWVAGGVASEPDQQCLDFNGDFLFGFPNELDVAQSFKPSQDNVLRKISIYIKKTGNPVDRTVRIITDKNGKPDKNGTISTGTLYASRVGAGYDWIDVSLQNPPDLLAEEIYWLMIENSTFPLDSENYYIWGKDKNYGYPRGEGKWSIDWNTSNPQWYPIIGDLNFKIWMGGEATYMEKVWITQNTYVNTITQSWIDGDAYYQIIDDKTTVSGVKHPDSPDPPNKDLPISYAQIQDWEKAACCDTGSGCKPECIYTGDYTPAEGVFLGPIKIEGNLIFPSNSDDNPIIINGPIWVTGNISASNSAGIKLKENLEHGYPIIADNPNDQTNYGKIELSNNVITQDSVQGGKLLFISTNKSLNENNPAIWLYNNVNKDEAQSIIYTLYGVIKVENNAKFIEVTGYAIHMENNAEIVYEEGLINSNFSSGPGGGWEAVKWKETE